MKYNNHKIKELFPWFINNTLSEADKERVENHLSECSECKKELEQMQTFSRYVEKYSQDYQAEHITSKMLVLYAEAKNELNRDDLSKVDRHLQFCQTCNSELNILKQVNQSLAKDSPTNLFNQIKVKIRNRFPQFLLKPALAYVIILCLLYPAWLGIYQLRKEIRKMQEPQIAQSNYQLFQSNYRSDEESEQDVLITPKTDILSFSFSIPILNSENIRYNALIIDNNNEAVWKQDNIKSLDSYGSMLLICNRNFFEESSYTLKINEVNIETGKIQEEYYFYFKIKKE